MYIHEVLYFLLQEPVAQSGFGRIVTLENALSVAECIKSVKSHLCVEQLQVALGHDKNMGEKKCNLIYLQ